MYNSHVILRLVFIGAYDGLVCLAGFGWFLWQLPEVASDGRVHDALHLDRNTRKGLQAMLTMG